MQWLRADWVLPVAGPAIADGVVMVERGRILQVGRRADLPRPSQAEARDFGRAVLLPGLVNAHTHLEFSSLAEPLGRPGNPLPEWIRTLVAWRRRVASDAAAGAADEAEATRRANVRRASVVWQGLQESLAAGVTTVGEIATPFWPRAALLPKLHSASHIVADHSADSGREEVMGSAATLCPRLVVFHELLGLSEARLEANLPSAEEHLAANWPSSVTAGLSPHAPYSVSQSLLREAIEISRGRPLTLAMHVAESREELELLATGGGAFRRLLEDLGDWDAAAFARAARPLDFVRQLSAAHRALVVHANYLDDEEVAELARQRERLSVVYCPRTHAFFGHERHPWPRLLAAGARLAIGTDSRASNPDLNLMAELRHWYRQGGVSAAQVLRGGTLSGAEALGLAAECGSLEAGKRADVCVFSAESASTRDVLVDLLEGDSQPSAVCVGGAWQTPVVGTA